MEQSRHEIPVFCLWKVSRYSELCSTAGRTIYYSPPLPEERAIRRSKRLSRVADSKHEVIFLACHARIVVAMSFPSRDATGNCLLLRTELDVDNRIRATGTRDRPAYEYSVSHHG